MPERNLRLAQKTDLDPRVEPAVDEFWGQIQAVIDGDEESLLMFGYHHHSGHYSRLSLGEETLAAKDRRTLVLQAKEETLRRLGIGPLDKGKLVDDKTKFGEMRLDDMTMFVYHSPTVYKDVLVEEVLGVPRNSGGYTCKELRLRNLNPKLRSEKAQEKMTGLLAIAIGAIGRRASAWEQVLVREAEDVVGRHVASCAVRVKDGPTAYGELTVDPASESTSVTFRVSPEQVKHFLFNGRKTWLEPDPESGLIWNCGPIGGYDGGNNFYIGCSPCIQVSKGTGSQGMAKAFAQALNEITRGRLRLLPIKSKKAEPKL